MRSSLAPPRPAGAPLEGPAPTFSVLIPAYQAADTIGEAIESALGQTTPPLEVIVCDDGSTDAIDAALEPYRERITLLRKPNGGGASALNVAAREASGDFVGALDADDRYEPERLEALTELAVSRPDLDMLGTDAWFDVDGELTGRFNRANPFAVHDQRRAILDRCFLFHPAVRRQRLLAIGGFDESLPIAYDWDCWIRLLLDGAAVGLVDEPLVRYRQRAGSLTSKRAAALRDRVRVLQKVARRDHLTPAERTTLDAALRRAEGRARLAEAEAALAGPGAARRSLLSLARAPATRPSTRAKALLAAAAPGAARRVMRAREPAAS